MRAGRLPSSVFFRNSGKASQTRISRRTRLGEAEAFSVELPNCLVEEEDIEEQAVEGQSASFRFLKMSPKGESDSRRQTVTAFLALRVRSRFVGLEASTRNVSVASRRDQGRQSCVNEGNAQSMACHGLLLEGSRNRRSVRFPLHRAKRSEPEIELSADEKSLGVCKCVALFLAELWEESTQLKEASGTPIPNW